MTCRTNHCFLSLIIVWSILIQGRIEFLKRLPQALSLFTATVVRQRILPPLLLQLRDLSLAVFALPTVLEIAKNAATTQVYYLVSVRIAIIKRG